MMDEKIIHAFAVNIHRLAVTVPEEELLDHVKVGLRKLYQAAYMAGHYEDAEPDEPMFVLRARDPHAHYLVRIWAAMRQGNHPEAAKTFARALQEPKRSDAKRVFEAVDCSVNMIMWRTDREKKK